MPAPIRTLDDTIGWEQARLGRSRLTQNDWAAGAVIDDCALFQSTAVFGQKAAWDVDAFKTLDGGTYHPGRAGLQRGDVVLFDWNGNGIADHTEMALSSPDAGGTFQTIGANGSDTISVAYRQRNSYVLGYFRPAYPVPASTPAVTRKDAEDMALTIRNPKNGAVYTVAPEYCRHEASSDTVQYVTDVLTAEDTIVQCSTETEFLSIIDALGIPRSIPEQLIGGKVWSRQLDVLAALKVIDSPIQLTNAQ
jgi:hypothetical protein